MEWFRKINNKNKYHFIQFDIVEFYPSITEQLLCESLDWANGLLNISTLNREIIMAAKKTLLYNESVPWCKKGAQNFFDVTMGSYDGAECCELVGVYILNKLKTVDADLGLYREDGLGASAKTKRQIENLKKDIKKIFNELGLKITIDANLKCVDFLDVTLDLKTGLHKPFLKQNNTLQYVHISSNHPSHVIDNIPKGVEDRLSLLSSNEEIFRRAIAPYQEALRKAGHDYILKFKPPKNQQQPPKKRCRKRWDEIWFNPPFSKTIKTKVGKDFFKIIDQCFPKSNPLSKRFNRHTIKLSFSCMPNMGKIVSGHNKKILKGVNLQQRLCNCRVPENCPLEGECLSKNVIYQANVKRLDTQTSETYIGLTSKTFKERWNNHKTSFRLENHKNESKLSTYIWELKEQNVNFEIRWKIKARTSAYSPASKNAGFVVKKNTSYFFNLKRQALTKDMNSSANALTRKSSS